METKNNELSTQELAVAAKLQAGFSADFVEAEEEQEVAVVVVVVVVLK